MTVTLSGSTGIQQPATQLAGSSSGVVTLTGAANAGTWTMTLPTSGGTNGYVLGTDGTGITNWVAQTGGGSGGSYTRTTITATAGQTSFTASYTVNYVQVYVNGVLLNSADYTASTGTTVVLAAAAAAGDIVDVVAFTVGSITGSVTITGTPSSGQLAAWTGATSIQGIAAPATAGNVVFSTDGSTWSSTQKIVQGTSQATTSGTSIDFTGIPSWAKRITVMFQNVSLSGVANILLQIGTGGSPTTTGYISGTSSIGTVATSASSTSGVPIYLAYAAGAISGSIVFTNLSSNTWTASGVFGYNGATGTATSGGSVSLSGVLNIVRITTTNGTDTFDAGSVNILYE